MYIYICAATSVLLYWSDAVKLFAKGKIFSLTYCIGKILQLNTICNTLLSTQQLQLV